jgi:hypothetical protein
VGRQHNFESIHPWTIPISLDLNWLCSFRRGDLYVIFYQNMPNLRNRYKSAEGNISQKTGFQVIQVPV